MTCSGLYGKPRPRLGADTLLTFSPEPFKCLCYFLLTKSQPPLKMRKFCENNFRKLPVSSKLMNPAFPVNLHPERQTSHPQQTPVIPTPFPPAPSHICLSPRAQLQPPQRCCCRRAAGDNHPSLGEGGDFGFLSCALYLSFMENS